MCRSFQYLQYTNEMLRALKPNLRNIFYHLNIKVRDAENQNLHPRTFNMYYKSISFQVQSQFNNK